MDFPCWRYHPVHARTGFMFKSQEELDSAGEGWVGTPAAFGVVTHPPEKIPGAPPPPGFLSPAPVAVEPPAETGPTAETEPPAEKAVVPSTEADAKAVVPSVSAQEVKLMNKPELYALAVDLPGIREAVPADIETIKKKELLALVLSALPKE